MRIDFFSLETLIAIISLAISVGGFIPTFFMRDRKREIALAMILTTLVVTSGILFTRSYQHEQRIKRTSAEIIQKLNVERRTFDQLYEQIYYPDFLVLNESLDNLINSGVVGHKILDVRDNKGENYRVRAYYLRSQ